MAIGLIFGFDIDGVLTADDDGKQNVWIQEAARYLNVTPIKASFRLDEALGVKEEVIEEFFQEKGESILANMPIRPHCQKVLTDLKARGALIHLITARQEGFRSTTLEWLSKHNICYDALHMNPNPNGFFSKGKLCRNLQVQFFVDDSFANCVDLYKHNIYTLMFSTSHNQEKTSPVPIVHNWYEIEEKIATFISPQTTKQA